MSKPTADWERIGDRFYRKTQLYTSVFDPDLEIENYVVTGAPYSGAVGRHNEYTVSSIADRHSDLPGRKQDLLLPRFAGCQIHHRHLQLRWEVDP
jgi:hypothetical protein